MNERGRLVAEATFLEQHPDAVAKFLRRSLMPEGLLDAFTPEQVSDLFAYLKSLK